MVRCSFFYFSSVTLTSHTSPTPSSFFCIRRPPWEGGSGRTLGKGSVRYGWVIFHCVLFNCITRAFPVPALLSTIRLRICTPVGLRPRIVARQPQQSTAAGVLHGRGRWDLFTGVVIFTLPDPRWYCGAAVRQRPPIKASRSSLYGHIRQQRAAGHGDTWPRTIMCGRAQP